MVGMVPVAETEGAENRITESKVNDPNSASAQ